MYIACISLKKTSILLLLVILCGCGGDDSSGNNIGGGQEPPFAGTIFITPDIIQDTDPTSFVSLNYVGQSDRKMLDRRSDKFITYNAHLYIASFDDGVALEIQVNPEFPIDEATNEAEKYSIVVGQIPYTLRKALTDVSIHAGDAPFSGDDKNIVIHTIQGEEYISEGILAETLIHETVHAVLDEDHKRATAWANAQQQDLGFISTYAQNNPFREDLAESFVPYLAVRYKSDRISLKLKETITSTMQHRINYFEGLDIEIYPME
jgi:hypothetical protein